MKHKNIDSGHTIAKKDVHHHHHAGNPADTNEKKLTKDFFLTEKKSLLYNDPVTAWRANKLKKIQIPDGND
ncbi:hypothetical protein DERF_006000 [Dermatophagoides farinae]|uniref:Uncharacterized protein n=1 Tax=Dermatophagoides farinae TaxID=6954 RepID=A0A922LBT6_DERFA|nr:hypothetical protein DERF_006000 [Dermatophagoides farinae]